MNTTALPDIASMALPDTQAGVTSHRMAVTGAGISGLRMPVQVVDVDGQTHGTVMTADAEVMVAAHQRGTHMSRLVETIDRLTPRLELAELHSAHSTMLARLGSDAGQMTLRFPWFVSKKAPVSGIESWLDLEVQYQLSGTKGTGASLRQALRMPVTTLCPCSKTISRYGAHNQRSYVTIAIETDRPIAIGALLSAVEEQSSCAIYALLKRSDEKFVTEAAYDNPKFAEDIVRDVYAAIEGRWRVDNLGVATENQESIHNHAAYAYIGADPRKLLNSV